MSAMRTRVRSRITRGAVNLLAPGRLTDSREVEVRYWGPEGQRPVRVERHFTLQVVVTADSPQALTDALACAEEVVRGAVDARGATTPVL